MILQSSFSRQRFFLHYVVLSYTRQRFIALRLLSRERFYCITLPLATALLLLYVCSRDSAFIALVSFSRQRFFLKTGSQVVRDSAFYLETGSTGFSRQRFSLYKESKTGSVRGSAFLSIKESKTGPVATTLFFSLYTRTESKTGSVATALFSL